MLCLRPEVMRQGLHHKLASNQQYNHCSTGPQPRFSPRTRERQPRKLPPALTNTERNPKKREEEGDFIRNNVEHIVADDEEGPE